MEDKIFEVLANGGPVFLLLCWVLYWLLTRYIPSMQRTFKESLDLIVASYKEANEWIMERLEKLEYIIETKIK